MFEEQKEQAGMQAGRDGGLGEVIKGGRMCAL